MFVANPTVPSWYGHMFKLMNLWGNQSPGGMSNMSPILWWDKPGSKTSKCFHESLQHVSMFRAINIKIQAKGKSKESVPGTYINQNSSTATQCTDFF